MRCGVIPHCGQPAVNFFNKINDLCFYGVVRSKSAVRSGLATVTKRRCSKRCADELVRLRLGRTIYVTHFKLGHTEIIMRQLGPRVS